MATKPKINAGDMSLATEPLVSAAEAVDMHSNVLPRLRQLELGERSYV